MHAPGLAAALHAEVDGVCADLQAPQVAVFAHAGLHLLTFQAGGTSNLPGELWNESLARHPQAVFDALRWCFNEPVAAYLAAGVERTFTARSETPLATLLMRLGIARPAVSDDFAAEMTRHAGATPGGLAALCQWRCSAVLDEAKALQAVQDADDENGLWALLLAGHPAAAPLAQQMLQRHGDAGLALAVCAAHDSPWLRQAIAAPGTDRVDAGGDGDGLPLAARWYGAALLGDISLLRAWANLVDLTDDGACRALADAIALLTGNDADALFDPGLDAEQRRQFLAAVLAEPGTETASALEGRARRAGRARDEVLLQDAALLTGAPLRQLLYAEYAARTRSPLMVAADELAMLQVNAVATASAFETAAR